MDVFLIPTTTAGRYELYYEAPEDEGTEEEESGALYRLICKWPFLHRQVKKAQAKFADALAEAEEWRHRRHAEEPEPQGLWSRSRRKIMGFIVERIAEQRLLWHMRRAESICARIPSDLNETEASAIVRRTLKGDHDHHFKWMFIDLGLLILSAPLVFVPGPNLPGFYFFFQTVGHFLSWRGARQGLNAAAWTYRPTADLAELGRAMTMPPSSERVLRFRELALRLQLQHLETFCEDVAAPTA